jgi:hypothetical protein
MLADWIRAVGKAALPAGTRHWLRMQQQRLRRWPPVGWVRFGGLRRLKPISRVFGMDRGLCIDRYYIERFLSLHRSDIRGHVLEIGDDVYTRRYGGDRVIKSEVLHVTEDNPKATVVADLTATDAIPSNTYDCMILTQTLQFIYEVRVAIRTIYRILKPGGVLLATFSGLSQISRYDMDRWGEYWRVTSRSAQRLFEESFPATAITVETHGNVLTTIAFLHGLATQELRQEELDFRDPDYEMIITVRAEKPETT